MGLPSGGEPDPNWPPAAKRAWTEVESIARRAEAEDLPLDQPERLWALARDVFRAVARQYHPEASQAELETPRSPGILDRGTRGSRLSQGVFRETFRGRTSLRWATSGDCGACAIGYRQFYFLYRVVSFGWNPVSALLREARDAAANQMLVTSTSDVKLWAVGFCVRRAGFYAILLYSGPSRMGSGRLGDVSHPAFRTRRPTRRRISIATDRGTAADSRGPVRFKSGKSSVINALFGQPRAAVDVVPRTRYIEPYVLEREGMPQAILLDTAGLRSRRRPERSLCPA